jgi:hypothetical protein
MGEALASEVPVGRCRPAFGDAGPPPEVEATKEANPPLDRRTEAMLAVAIVAPVVAAYGAVAYGIYSAVGAI